MKKVNVKITFLRLIMSTMSYFLESLENIPLRIHVGSKEEKKETKLK